MKVVTVVGARPQFVKAAAISRRLRERHEEILVHTGQHYDYEMSGIFFDGLELPAPAVNLGVGSGRHGAQTAAMLHGIEEVVLDERPDWLLLYGDTNSTLAGALAASKLSLPVAHVEAGVRSFDRDMPEEVNRVLTDQLSTLLLCPSDEAVRNLAAEGVRRHVHVVGDVMLDVLNWARDRADRLAPALLRRLGVMREGYVVATVHRAGNTDDGARFAAIIEALNALDEPVIFPVHPRTRALIADGAWPLKPHVHPIDPLGYLDMMALVASARLVVTDSGGLQKEAYWLSVPCLTLRRETEWVETVQAGWNTLVDCDPRAVVTAAYCAAPTRVHPDLYGDGSAATQCIDLLERVGSR